MDKFNILYNKIRSNLITEAVHTDMHDGRAVYLVINDAKDNRQFFIFPTLSLKLMSNDIGDKRHKLDKITVEPIRIPSYSSVFSSDKILKFDRPEETIKTRVILDIDELSAPLKEFLSSEELGNYCKNFKNGGFIDDKKGFEEHKDAITSKLSQLLDDEYKSNKDFAEKLQEAIDNNAALGETWLERDKKKKEHEEKNVVRDSDEEPWLEDDNDINEISFVHYFKGKGDARYKLIGASIDDVRWDDEEPYVHLLTWHYIGPDGEEASVRSDKAYKEIGLDPEDYFVEHVKDWYIEECKRQNS